MVDEVLEDTSRQWAIKNVLVLLRWLEDLLQSLALAMPETYPAGPAGRDLREVEPMPSFPNLHELFLSGRPIYPTTSSFAPQTTILHLYRTPSTFQLQQSLLQRWFPRLTHLRISPSSHASTTEFNVRVLEAAGRMGILSQEDLQRLDYAYAGLIADGSTGELCGRLIAIEADDSVLDSFTVIMRNFPSVFDQAGPRFVLRPLRPESAPARAQPLIKTHWLERLQGKPGSWPVAEEAV